jgi:hypothetical protein
MIVALASPCIASALDEGLDKIKRFQESATSLIAPSGQCQAYLPYGQEGVLV